MLKLFVLVFFSVLTWSSFAEIDPSCLPALSRLKGGSYKEREFLIYDFLDEAQERLERSSTRDDLLALDKRIEKDLGKSKVVDLYRDVIKRLYGDHLNEVRMYYHFDASKTKALIYSESSPIELLIDIRGEYLRPIKRLKYHKGQFPVPLPHTPAGDNQKIKYVELNGKEPKGIGEKEFNKRTHFAFKIKLPTEDRRVYKIGQTKELLPEELILSGSLKTKKYSSRPQAFEHQRKEEVFSFLREKQKSLIKNVSNNPELEARLDNSLEGYKEYFNSLRLYEDLIKHTFGTGKLYLSYQSSGRKVLIWNYSSEKELFLDLYGGYANIISRRKDFRGGSFGIQREYQDVRFHDYNGKVIEKNEDLELDTDFYAKTHFAFEIPAPKKAKQKQKSSKSVKSEKIHVPGKAEMDKAWKSADAVQKEKWFESARKIFKKGIKEAREKGLHTDIREVFSLGQERLKRILMNMLRYGKSSQNISRDMIYYPLAMNSRIEVAKTASQYDPHFLQYFNKYKFDDITPKSTRKKIKLELITDALESFPDTDINYVLRQLNKEDYTLNQKNKFLEIILNRRKSKLSPEAAKDFARLIKKLIPKDNEHRYLLAKRWVEKFPDEFILNLRTFDFSVQDKNKLIHSWFAKTKRFMTVEEFKASGFSSAGKYLEFFEYWSGIYSKLSTSEKLVKIDRLLLQLEEIKSFLSAHFGSDDAAINYLLSKTNAFDIAPSKVLEVIYGAPYSARVRRAGTLNDFSARFPDVLSAEKIIVFKKTGRYLSREFDEFLLSLAAKSTRVRKNHPLEYLLFDLGFTNKQVSLLLAPTIYSPYQRKKLLLQVKALYDEGGQVLLKRELSLQKSNIQKMQEEFGLGWEGLGILVQAVSHKRWFLGEGEQLMGDLFDRLAINPDLKNMTTHFGKSDNSILQRQKNFMIKFQVDTRVDSEKEVKGQDLLWFLYREFENDRLSFEHMMEYLMDINRTVMTRNLEMTDIHYRSYFKVDKDGKEALKIIDSEYNDFKELDNMLPRTRSPYFNRKAK